MTERWATLSVKDHINTQDLITNVLLYDRLIFPVPPKGEEKEFLRWKNNGWQPGLLRERLTKLGDDSVVEVPWDENRQEIFKEKMQQLEDIKFDVTNAVNDTKQRNPYPMTRKILAQDQELNIKDYDVDVIAAYSSETNLNSDFTLEHDESNSNTNIMFGQKIKIPTGDNLEEVLVKSINLSKIRDFKNHRRKFYKWEDDLIKEKTPKQWILKEFEDLNREYNEIVDSHFEKTTLRFLFTIAGIGLGLGGALVNPMMLPGVLLTSVKFLTLDRKPAIPFGDSEPVAMFHDIEDTFLPKPIWKRFINFF